MRNLLSILFLFGSVASAQIGIGTQIPHTSAILDVESTTKGFLPPRLTTSERDAINGGVFTEGLVIYNSDIKCVEFYNNTEWINICGLSTGPNLPEPPANIESIPVGVGALSSRYCFDIAESNDLSMGAGSLLQRKFRRADFGETSVNTQTLRFTSTNPVSNLTFYAVDPSGNVLASFTPDADYSANGSLTEATAQIVYKSNLSSPDPESPTNGAALGLHVSSALRPTFYVVYNDQINGGGTEVKQKFSPSIRDSQCSTNQTSQSQASLFLTSTGDVYSIGVNSAGLLGDGTLVSKDHLIQVTLPNPAINLVSGWGVTYVIDNTGELYGWGTNGEQIGVGSSATHEPSPLNVTFPNGEKAIQIACSNGNNLALTDANKIYGWGQIHAPGSLGSTLNGPFSTPQLATIPAGVTPVSIMNGASQNFFFGDDGELYSSGVATSIGRNTTPAYEFKKVTFPNNVKVHTAATTGIGVLAIGFDEKLYGFGLNYYGEQGVGSPGISAPAVIMPIEVPVTGMGTPVQIFKGYYSSFILDDQNKLFASGYNANGQLGLGDISNRSMFEEVTLPPGVVPVDVITNYTTIYIIADDGNVYSAGDDTVNNLLQRTVDASHPADEFHLCTSSILTNNTIIPN
ncbi:MAG: RCC1 domain-containing protein [Flavobacteriales bacterium]